MKLKTIVLPFMGLPLIAACTGVEGTRGYQGTGDYIAVAADYGIDASPLSTDNAAIAVDPDGCQHWLIDDGLEGRASNRLDPVSGLPVCSPAGRPGVVYGSYQSGNEGIADRVPRTRPAQQIETFPVRPNSGAPRNVMQPRSH